MFDWNDEESIFCNNEGGDEKEDAWSMKLAAAINATEKKKLIALMFIYLNS